MKNFFALATALLFLIFLGSCDKEEDAADPSFSMKAPSADYTAACVLPVTTVAGEINVNTVWDNDHVWEIDGVLRVKGATLTIEPGTFIKAKPRSGNQATGVLLITKTGKINAAGTADAPIIFTSYKLLDCDAATVAKPGDFGGVVILGDAIVNNGSVTNIAEGLGDQNPLTDFQYGGSNNNHNGGIIQYVRIEFAGRVLSYDNGDEVNGLTFGGVGSGTTVNHVMVSWALDDSYEFFGGKVSATHLVSFSAYDDNFDFDLGYTGSIIKAIAIANQDSGHSISTTSPDSNGIELDNNANLTNTTLITRPVIKQMSIIGLQCNNQNVLENGIHVRRNGQIDMQNVTVTGYPNGVRWELPSVRSGSSVATCLIHGGTTAVMPAGTALGIGNLGTFGCPMPAWGLTQPFFNLPGFDLSGTTGAFATETGWATAGWTKYDNW